MTSAMRNADVHGANSGLLEDLARSSAEGNDRCAARFVADLDISPANSPSPPGAQGLEDCFFGCPASSVVLGGSFFGRAIIDFVLGIDTGQEQFAMAFDHLSNSQALDDVGADADDL